LDTKQFMAENEKKVKVSVVVIAIIIIAVFLFLTTGLLIYIFGMDNNYTQKISKVIPYPAATINYKKIILLSELKDDLKSIKMFYENQDFSEIGMRVDFNTSDGQKRLKIKERNLLNKKIEDAIIRDLAEKKGIKLNSDDISQEVERKISEYGDREEITKNLMNLYGWDIEKFKLKIVKPDMYKESLSKSIQEDDKEMMESRKKINMAASALKNKEDFDDVAKKYSEGDSAKEGGELGWLTADQLIPEVAIAAFIHDKGDVSDIIESEIGLHIINIEDKKTEDGIDKVKLRQIFVRSKNFGDWLLEQEKSYNIYIPLKDYYWDKNSQEVQFRSNDLREFESKLLENSPDDISIIF